MSQRHFILLGISLAVCPQEMSWQEQKLGNDELSPGRLKMKLFLIKLQIGSLIEGTLNRLPGEHSNVASAHVAQPRAEKQSVSTGLF